MCLSTFEIPRQMASSFGLTFVLLPGSLTVVNCSSLYFWKAGVIESRSLGSLTVNFLTSALLRLLRF